MGFGEAVIVSDLSEGVRGDSKLSRFCCYRLHYDRCGTLTMKETSIATTPLYQRH